jgi:hypothetical protein
MLKYTQVCTCMQICKNMHKYAKSCSSMHKYTKAQTSMHKGMWKPAQIC